MAEDDARERVGKFRQRLATVIVNLSTISFCTALGWTSPTELLLTSDESPMGKLSGEEFSWLSSITFLAGVVGSLIWGIVLHRIGIKLCGHISGLCLIISWIVFILTTSFEYALFARVLAGFGGASCFIIWPTYVTEICNDKNLGELSSYLMFLNNFGILLVYILGAFMSYFWLNVSCLIISITFPICFYFLPESPEFLWRKGRLAEAENVLTWFRGGDRTAAKKHLDYLEELRKTSGNCTFRDLVKNRCNRKAMIVGHGVFAAQQFCGIIPILTFAAGILQAAGVRAEPKDAAIAAGVAQFIGSAMSTQMVDRFRRKPLLLSSLGLMAGALLILGVYFWFHERNYEMSKFSVVPVICMSVHLLAYGYGIGPVPYNTISETLSPDIRSLATGTMITSATFFVFVTVKIVEPLKEGYGYSGCFWFFTICTVLFYIFTFVYVPETFKRPLHEVLLELSGGARPNASKSVTKSEVERDPILSL